MKAIWIIISMIILEPAISQELSLLEAQKRYPRVREAIKSKEEIIEVQLKTKGLEIADFSLVMVAYKAEDLLEIYGKSASDKVYKKVKSYQICSKSGSLGPKRKEGDYQVPEGFYHIDRFNPASSFHLSLGLNYPNESDRRMSTYPKLGGDIFIHGACVTIGCLPMTNDKIKEIYLYALHARNNGQEKIPVYVFPFKMTNENLTKNVDSNPQLNQFWRNLKVGHDQFVANRKILNFTVAKNGDYSFQ